MALIRDAQTHFEKAKLLDQDNVIAATFLEQVKLNSLFLRLLRLTYCARLCPFH